jgi:hypothetical protein
MKKMYFAIIQETNEKAQKRKKYFKNYFMCFYLFLYLTKRIEKEIEKFFFVLLEASSLSRRLLCRLIHLRSW